jgi:ribosomal protein S18 acetylase RimI-like enzyme
MTGTRRCSRIALRKARRSDAEVLQAIEAATFATDRIEAGEFLDLIASPLVDVWLAEEGTTAVGLAVVKYSPPPRREAYIYSLGVHPGHQGRGAGLVLLRVALLAASRRGATVVRLEVRTDNPRAQALYRLNGFAVQGRVDGWYADGAAATLMLRRLINFGSDGDNFTEIEDFPEHDPQALPCRLRTMQNAS